jgi:hypothetical protein
MENYHYFCELKGDMRHMLDVEYKYYLEHQQELLKLYRGQYLVIVGNAVVGNYASQAEAYLDSIKKYELGSFLIQECSDGNSGYTQTYHSRVIFA